MVISKDNKDLIYLIGYGMAFSSLVIILYVWVSANYNGSVYFTAGEPSKIVKYMEWFGMVIGIVVLSKTIHNVASNTSGSVIIKYLIITVIGFIIAMKETNLI